MARKGRRATFEEKVFALRLLGGSMSPDRVAEALGVGRESVFRWKRQARAGGIEALRIKKAPGCHGGSPRPGADHQGGGP
ncbi:helix-turn-helix domain-containing protein [Streptosporangium lutulentum]